MNKRTQSANSNPIKTFLAHASAGPRSLASMLAQRITFSLIVLGAGLMLLPPCWATPFQWEFTGSLSTARYHHSATLLPNGKVLVAGGFDINGSSASAELYDPVNGIWSVTGSLNTSRVSHTATLLPNGMVLVAGGSSDFVATASAELYDSATGTWSITGEPQYRAP